MAVLSDKYSCKLTGKFDFGKNSSANKWTTAQETYRLNTLRHTNASSDEDLYPFSVIETKSKLRGNGKALVLRWESTTGKDFEILGWSLPFERTTTA
jgi:hypothetical protein